MARPASIIDASAAGAALLADLLLDGDDEQIPIQQRGDGRLFSGCVQGAADFPPGSSLPRDINK
jgi:hypothetical protein